MGDHILERLNSLLLLPRVEHFRVELEVGVRLVLASLEHIALTLVTLVGGARLNDTVTALLSLRLSLEFTAFGSTGDFSLLVVLDLS